MLAASVISFRPWPDDGRLVLAEPYLHVRDAGAHMTVPEPSSIGDTMADALLQALSPKPRFDE